MKIRLNITGMTCVNCANAVIRATSKIDGVKNASVSLADNSALFELDANADESALSSQIKAKIKKLGYGVANNFDELAKAEQKALKALLIKLIISGVLSALIMYFHMAHPSNISHFYSQIFAFVACSVVIFWGGASFLGHAFKSLKSRNYDMNVLISLGSLCAYVYSCFVFFAPHLFAQNMRGSYFDGAAMIITFVLLGKFLEANSKQKAKDFLKNLMDLSPKTALLVGANGQESVVNANKLQIGDVVSIKSGFNVPCDGVIIAGGADINEAIINGESLPRYKSVGQSVYAGTTNLNGFINVRVSKGADETLLAEILELLQASGAAKMNISRLADKVANIFVPAVMLISLATLGLWAFFDLRLGILCAVCVLIISCPCALGLATPVASVCAISAAAKRGILVKNPSAFEQLPSAKYAVFDKTGTLSTGALSVASTSLNDEDLRVVAGIEALCAHPISRAICEHVKEYEKAAGKLEELAGMGLSYENGKVLIGSAALLAKYGVDLSSANSTTNFAGASVLVAIDGSYRGFIRLNENARCEAKSVISALKAQNLVPVMLTGDNEINAKKVANELEIDTFFAGILPTQKYEKIKELQAQGGVIFVGDGINDAPALRAANIGIAMSSGADIAKDAGDILLIKNDLNGVLLSLRLCAATLKTIKQNLAWAFIYNIICIPVAAGALYPLFGLLLSPAYGAAAMSISSVCVVLNSLRLKAFK